VVSGGKRVLVKKGKQNFFPQDGLGATEDWPSGKGRGGKVCRLILCPKLLEREPEAAKHKEGGQRGEQGPVLNVAHHCRPSRTDSQRTKNMSKVGQAREIKDSLPRERGEDDCLTFSRARKKGRGWRARLCGGARAAIQKGGLLFLPQLAGGQTKNRRRVRGRTS